MCIVFHSAEMMIFPGQGQACVFTTGVDCTICTNSLPFIGALQVTMATLKLWVAAVRSVTAACKALFTVTVTAHPGNASASQGPQGSDARSVNRGTCWWRATVFVSASPLHA